jgi:hypothetical protein
MSVLHQSIKVDLVSQQELMTERASFYHRNKHHIKEVATALKKIDLISAKLDNYKCVDISMTGDKHVLLAIFSAFRKLRYEPSERPGIKPTSSFSCYWSREGQELRFWISFSSTKCTRVKVGTETREVPIYETVCE